MRDQNSATSIVFPLAHEIHASSPRGLGRFFCCRLRVARWCLPIALIMLAMTTAYGASLSDTHATPLIRFPNPCGDRVVFSARDQIWSVPNAGGVAEPLTSGLGVRTAPKCSPDQRWIAYLQTTSGGRDVLVIPREGGVPKRLTFRPDATNIVTGWTPDSRDVVFLSSQADWAARHPTAFRVPVEGGMPVSLPMDKSGDISFAPDGRHVAYTRFFMDFQAWKRYDGGEAPKIYTFDLQTHKEVQITNWKGTDTAPMWFRDRIYFLSDRGLHRRANIWVYDLRTHKTRQLTHFDDYDIDMPSLGIAGISFSQGGKLWMIDLPSERLRSIPVVVPDDGTRTNPRTVSVAQQLREWDTDYDIDYTLSPHGEEAILAARGDLFTLAPMNGPALNLTASSNAEEDHPAVSPDGRWIAYTTDSAGEQQLAIRPVGGGSEKIITHFPFGFLYKPTWSPDCRWIAVHDSAHKLWLVDVSSGDTRLVAYNRDHYMHETDEHDATFSPDSKWLAYSTSRSTRLRALHMYSITQGRDTVVSSPMESDYRPAFSADGRFIFFVSDRHHLPIYADRETNAVTVKSGGIYVAALSADEVPPFASRDNARTNRTADPRATSTARDLPDIANLTSRAVPLPVEPSKISALEIRGDKVFYETDPPPLSEGSLPGEDSALHVIDTETRKDRILLSGLSSFALSQDGLHLIFVKNGDWFMADIGGESPKEKTLDIQALRSRVEPLQEWREMFEYSWRLERDLYVNADMNRVNWNAAHDHYARLLPLVATRSDLNWLLCQMIGELASSHVRAGGGDDLSSDPAPPPVLLGADYSLDSANHRYRFAKIFRGDNSRPEYRSPLTWPGVMIHEGDYLLSVNGHELVAPETPDSLLITTSGMVTLTVSETPGGVRREVKVDPVHSEARLRELDHLERERRVVTELSRGRIAYIGMTDMIGHGMDEFVQQFYPQLGAEGLIIDDRSNPGGNIDEMILERLRRNISSMQTGRDRVPQTQPDQVLAGPKAMLIDGFSGSDGEMFPAHFREYGLGPLIGSRTWGGVRGLRQSWTLLDGGWVIASEITFYDTHGHWLVENYGLDPDVPVDETPADVLAGREVPLETAVKLLLKKLGPTPHHLPAPPAPSSPDYPSAGDVHPAFFPITASETMNPRQRSVRHP